ncbi:MAG: prepilin-type N-terminal cleavage/methylation domain-containing protein [Phycisphaerae bacterium]|nr:prepilin-type N-terminal cleavage/methylation domain-containing protein [Phycisphaerae bacterium]
MVFYAQAVKGKSPRKNARGFTLIELLVVIAIISLLVSILLPSLQQAKELARKAACQSNLHSLQLSMSMYLNDSNGQFPFSYYKNPDKDHRIIWTDRLVVGGYVDYGEVFLCPSRPSDKNRNLWKKCVCDDPRPTDVGLYQSFWREPDYGYNAEGIGGLHGPTANVSDVTNPSEILLFLDSIWLNWGVTDTGRGTFFLYDRYKPPSSMEWYYVDPRHLDGCNIAWVDGHVSSIQAPDPDNRYETIFNALAPYWYFK